MAAATPVARPANTASVDEARRYFVEDPDAPRTARPGYDATIVEYLDYQCPVCRSADKTLLQLLIKDRKVRLIYRDWPIFGAQSKAAARIAIASNYQNKHHAVHSALMAAPRPLTDEKIEQAARKAGADWNRLQRDLKLHAKDIDDLLERNNEQAELLGLQGTPGFLVGNHQVFGGLSLDQFEKMIANLRTEQRTDKN